MTVDFWSNLGYMILSNARFANIAISGFWNIWARFRIPVTDLEDFSTSALGGHNRTLKGKYRAGAANGAL